MTQEEEIKIREKMVMATINANKPFINKKGDMYADDELAEYIISGKRKEDPETIRDDKNIRASIAISFINKGREINTDFFKDSQRVFDFVKIGKITEEKTTKEREKKTKTK